MERSGSGKTMKKVDLVREENKQRSDYPYKGLVYYENNNILGFTAEFYLALKGPASKQKLGIALGFGRIFEILSTSEQENFFYKAESSKVYQMELKSMQNIFVLKEQKDKVKEFAKFCSENQASLERLAQETADKLIPFVILLLIEMTIDIPNLTVDEIADVCNDSLMVLNDMTNFKEFLMSFCKSLRLPSLINFMDNFKNWFPGNYIVGKLREKCNPAEIAILCVTIPKVIPRFCRPMTNHHPKETYVNLVHSLSMVMNGTEKLPLTSFNDNVIGTISDNWMGILKMAETISETPELRLTPDPRTVPSQTNATSDFSRFFESKR